jgi:hypothetical protein
MVVTAHCPSRFGESLVAIDEWRLRVGRQMLAR